MKTIATTTTTITKRMNFNEEKTLFFFIFQLIPLVVVIGAGAVLATGISVRLLTQSPDVTLARKSNPEPWEKYRNKQYKVRDKIIQPNQKIIIF